MDLTPDAAVTVATGIAVALAATVLCFAALHDVAFRTVPNWTSLLLLLIGGALRVMSGTLEAGLIAGLLVFLGAVFCWRRGWLGGGDVKLLGATAILVPPMLAPKLLTDVALAGGVLAVVYLILARLVSRPLGASRQPGILRRVWRAERYRMYRRGPLPYASAIAVGALLILLTG